MLNHPRWIVRRNVEVYGILARLLRLCDPATGTRCAPTNGTSATAGSLVRIPHER